MAKRPVRNIGVIAHIDAGKTTVSERMLYYSHKEHRIGEVDSGTATMDWMPEEQRRGITICAAATTIDWKDYQINVIDTPGPVDFTSEVERSLRVLDGAVGVFCGTAGVQAQSETVWRQADTYDVPRLVFVNKLDRVGSDFFRVIEAIRDKLGANVVAAQVPIGREKEFVGVVDLIERCAFRFDAESLGEKVIEEDPPADLEEQVEELREKLIEAAAEFDDELMDTYLEGGELHPDMIRAAIRKGTLAGKLVPVFAGAALRNQGVQPLMDAVCHYLPAPQDMGSIKGTHPHTGKEVTRELLPGEPFCGLAFKTVADSHGDLVYMRVYSGKLKAGAQVINSRTGKKDRAQKLYLMHANHREQLDEAGAGSILAVVGFRHTSTGDTVSDPSNSIALEPPIFPERVITMAIEPISVADRDKLLECLDKLAREDPTFGWRTDKDTGQLVISGMGELHLEIIKERLEREFKVRATVGKPRVSYRQTIMEACSGMGVFDHKLGERSQYAEVSVSVEPGSDAGGCEIVNQLSKEDVPLEFQPAVEDSLAAAVESGGTLGLPLMRIRVRIIGGGTRQGEASAVAFATAANAAFDDALSSAESFVLEPMMRFEIQVPEEYYGNVSTDLNQRRTVIREVDLEGINRILRGVVPLAETFGYTGVLRSLTQGRGTISLEPESYAAVPSAVAARFKL
ncbi:MAG: elongation factor G [Planctomycetota bacterium]|nr:elongation factor G [Planctomycetota bacterium]